MHTDAAYPCHDQSEETIKAWMTEHATRGRIVVVRNTQGHVWEYHLDEIVAVDDPTKGRIRLHTATF